MRNKSSDTAIGLGLFLAVFLWGANNTGIRFLVQHWPPATVGSSRFLIAGWAILALLRWTPLLGRRHPVSPDLSRRLWWRSGLSMAAYILVFNWALKFTAVSHVALYLGASPVWALLWEGPPKPDWKSALRYGAAALALAGVVVLFWPALQHGSVKLLGEALGLTCSILWTVYGRQTREFRDELTGAEIAGHTFWRAGALMAPVALCELSTTHLVWRADLVWVQLFCVFGGGVVAFALWNNGLRQWPTSKVYLFSNLVPLTTMSWANLCLGEPITRTFWFAMLLIAGGVLLGQANWQRLLGARWSPPE